MSWSATGYTALLLAALLWTFGTFLSPLLHHAGSPLAAIGMHSLYSPVCHQDAARSPLVCNHPAGVCHRCSGIYVAFTCTVLLFPLFRRARILASFSVKTSILFILPMLLDYLLDVAGVWVNTSMSRLLTGALGGIGIALFTVPAWMEAWTQLFSRRGTQAESV
jgi:uncharacterized membrane protein